jgi:hypothetical protein
LWRLAGEDSDPYAIVATLARMVPKEKLMSVRRFKVQDGGKLGVMLVVDQTFESVIHWAKNEPMYQRLLADFEVQQDAPTIHVP